ncbi:hypothetical protein [Pilibacter termitis]|uniref:hypothetical protein n=1 Tax=Pilibacter termitis TaxID=263852 RepID=UPI0013563D20|nr:hypothetical protein [Pilibacter termitis]
MRDILNDSKKTSSGQSSLMTPLVWSEVESKKDKAKRGVLETVRHSEQLPVSSP